MSPRNGLGSMATFLLVRKPSTKPGRTIEQNGEPPGLVMPRVSPRKVATLMGMGFQARLEGLGKRPRGQMEGFQDEVQRKAARSHRLFWVGRVPLRK